MSNMSDVVKPDPSFFALFSDQINEAIAAAQVDALSEAQIQAIVDAAVGTAEADDLTEEQVQTLIDAAIAALPPPAGGSADDVTYDNTTSGLTAADVQAALDEVAAAAAAIGGVDPGTAPTVITEVQVHDNYKNSVTSTIDLSASAQYGDVAVIAAWRQSGAWNTPAGWTLIASDAGSSTLPKVFGRLIVDPSDAVALLSGANTDPNWGGAFGILLRGTDLDSITAEIGLRVGAGNAVLPALDTERAARDMVFGFYSGAPNVAAIAVPAGYAALDHYEWVYPANGGIYEAGLVAQATDAAAASLAAVNVALPNTGAGIRIVAEYAPLSPFPTIDYSEGIVVVNHGATAGTTRPSGAAVVYWIGSVSPTNAEDQDLWYDTTA